MVKEFHSYEFNKGTVSLHVVKSGFAQITPPHDWEVTSPPFSRLYYMLEGEQEVLVDKKPYLLKKDHIYLLPTAHAAKTHTKTYAEQLFFHVNVFDYAGFDILASCPMCEGIPCSDAQSLAQLYHSLNEIDLFTLRNRISQDLIRFISAGGLSVTQKNYPPVVIMAIDYIKSNLSAKLSTKDVCNHLFTSKSTISLYFRQYLDRTVGEYIDELLMAKAKHLLLNKKLNLSEIAFSLGFSDQFYFSRKFKDKCGITPSTYRKSNLADQL